MKKIFLLILIITVCILLVSCNSQNESTDDKGYSSFDSSLQNTDTSVDETESSSESETVDENNAYRDIPRFVPSGYKKCTFAIDESSYVLKTEIPLEWLLSRIDGGYKIIRSGKQIGSVIISEANDEADWEIVSTRQKTNGEITTVEKIEKKGTGDTLEFRYRWQYSFIENDEPKQINIYVNCPEVYPLVSYTMYSDSDLKPLRSDPQMGTLPSSLDGKNMLILGNSFVGTSNIGRILQDLLLSNGKNGTVTPISIGMGNIGKYAIDEDLLNTLRSGDYDVLFISGFYTSDDTMSLKIFKEACEAGGVALVVMPAHNENLSSAMKSAKACELPMINWKGELDELIASGIDKSYLCINDSYSHSTPLAGYVGAHMIYRAIYAQAPENSGTILSEYEISRLGDYASTGVFYVANPAGINYLK